MCDICRMNPCHSQCPNSLGPKVVDKCANCGESIYEGDTMYKINGNAWCEDCIDDCCQIAELTECWEEWE